MRLHTIRSPLAPLNKGGTRFSSKSPYNQGDLGGSRYVQRPIKLVLRIFVLSPQRENAIGTTQKSGASQREPLLIYLYSLRCTPKVNQ